MSLLSTPWIADRIARTMGRAHPRLKDELRFEEIRGESQPVRVPTRHGDVACTLYRPPSASPAGIYLNFHGGGFVIRAPEQDDPLCRYLAEKADVFVLNVDYDTSPGVRFPVAVEQAYDVTVWASLAPERAWDDSRIGVGGQSAGGALAAGAARLALENGTPAITLQVLHYPPLDLVTPAREKSAGRKRVVISPWLGEIFDTAYVPDRSQRRDRLASPGWGSNGEGIEGIAPALVVTCEVDRLRAEGIRYAEALREAGALREHVDLTGLDHGYNLMTTRADAERGYRIIAAHVRETLGPAG